MRKIVVFSMLSLDGVMQGPGGPDEDRSGDFRLGGWVAPFGDEEYAKAVQEDLQPAEYLLGRVTFQIWENYWPKNADFWPGIHAGMKYVLSNTVDSTAWQNTSFVRSVEEIKKLRMTDGSDLHVWGSSRLVQLLLSNDLVDELRLKIHPVVLGEGKRLFDNSSIPSSLGLTKNTVTPGGVIIAHYAKRGAVQSGRAGE